jgi:hypothetical protein
MFEFLKKTFKIIRNLCKHFVPANLNILIFQKLTTQILGAI